MLVNPSFYFCLSTSLSFYHLFYSRHEEISSARRWQSLAQPVACSNNGLARSSANAAEDAIGEQGPESKRLTLRWRPSDQYSLSGSFEDFRRECTSGVPTTSAEPCAAIVKTAFHSTARLRVSAVTSSLENLLTRSMVKVEHGL